MNLVSYMAERARWVDAALDKALPSAEEPPAELHAAMRHLLFPGGKRLRPALAFAGAEAVGAPSLDALPMAVAVELVHTYSLVHDDLPCMDDDVERRGRPTVHVAYGESTALLAGDALLTAAFAVLGDAGASHPPDRVLPALRELAEAAGSRQLVGGQVEDLAFDASRADEAAVESIHRRKTAALMTASVVGGARMGGAGADAQARLREYGERIGIAFQIADDLLDADEDDACSLVGVLGVDAARARAEKLLDVALGRLEPFGAAAEPLRAMARFAVRRDR